MKARPAQKEICQKLSKIFFKLPIKFGMYSAFLKEKMKMGLGKRYCVPKLD